ncbi:CoA pyrophosphatase [Gammaproteobacteria bacterium]|jgi:8-oxo-dGTP pyrophosphatase MutT (NUDIX family)|nr:CoA pyrophosphatase [Gammaproteobacteria bacterium]MDA9145991.1 CoA pyrophosphatase [Gammaproteobacteria bacterium]MDA9561527.1 CoA pyrophosphatase [Gammaproteobacteria bacterium]MDA9570307.1 CoA pyrophosphatase [Gammaproteobacteria bacterium]MDA9575381.1 CoA pyrophosphatase [Gammaproteobacteria bacterium]|tara:strand:+ start:960 stop:1556 length:597 start_codon:yes stop_codon:yes gene_type:complete
MIDSIKQKLEKLNPIKPTSLKKAGVFIGILYHDEFIENPEVIFTQRSAKVSTHSGEVSFPGGKWEEGDKDLYETSLRESNEEINLNINDVTYLGSLNYLISKHKIEVNPYIGLVTKKQNFIDNDEIAHTFTVPLDFLINNAREHNIERKNTNVIVPSWVYNDQTIWGLTALITADFINTCFDKVIKADLDIIREQYDY